MKTVLEVASEVRRAQIFRNFPTYDKEQHHKEWFERSHRELVEEVKRSRLTKVDLIEKLVAVAQEIAEMASKLEKVEELEKEVKGKELHIDRLKDALDAANERSTKMLMQRDQWMSLFYMHAKALMVEGSPDEGM